MNFLLRILKAMTFVIISILAISSSCLAETYYVDNVNGKDANSGLSSSLAWKTISKVNGARFQPGDQILFAAGQTWRELLIMPSNGVSGNPITFGAYGTGAKPIISGGSYISDGWTLLSGSTYSKATQVWIDRAGHARIFNGSKQLTQNSSSTLAADQYYFQYSGYPQSSGSLKSGTLYVNIGKPPGTTDIEAVVRKVAIQTNKSYLNFIGLNLTKAAFGISQYTAQADYVIVRNCTINFCTTGIYCGASTTVNAGWWLVENCMFHDNGQNNVFDQTLYIKFCSNWIIQNNIFKNNGAFAININGSSNNIVRYNYSEGHGGGFLEFYQDTAGGSKNNQVYYNISNNDKGFFYSGGGTGHTGNVIYNNVAYGFSFGIAVDVGTLSALKNNILWSSKSNIQYFIVSLGASITSSSNNVIGPFGSGATIRYRGSNYSSLAAFKNTHPSLEVDSIGADPLFVSAGFDFHLTGPSPCREAGADLSLSRDFDGNALPSSTKPDMGAYQYTGKRLNPPTDLRFQ